jgi:AAA domain
MTRTPGPDEARRAVVAAAEVPARRLVLTPASAIQPEPVVWAWEDEGQGRIPAGSLGLFAGREGTGKSSFLIWLSARITTGTLPGSFSGPRGVIYVAVEDSWKYTIVPRLIAAGADLDLVYRAEVKTIEDDSVSLSLPADNKLLADAITGHHVAMVALDPLMSAISDTLDTHVNRQVRQALDPLARIADQTGAVIAGIAHFNKSSSADASSLITASGAFKDVARFIFAFATDDEDGAQVITQTKNSLGLSSLPSLAYHIIEAIVPTAKGDAKVGKFVLDGLSERSVRDILSVQPGGEERDALARAVDYLRKALADGPRPTKDVEEEAREVHRITKRTLDRARSDLKIRTAKRGNAWWVSLPEHEGDLSALPAKAAKDAKDGTVGNIAKVAKSTSPREVGTVGILPGSGSCVGCGGVTAPGYALCLTCERAARPVTEITSNRQLAASVYPADVATAARARLTELATAPGRHPDGAP